VAYVDAPSIQCAIVIALLVFTLLLTLSCCTVAQITGHVSAAVLSLPKNP
jgi:hypothetical protein